MMTNSKKDIFSGKMIQVWTTIPEGVLKEIDKKAQYEYIKVADILRKYILNGFKEEFKK